MGRAVAGEARWVRGPPSPPLWASLHTTDFSGGQRWSRGDKGRFLHFYSLFHHYDLDLQRDGWRRWEEEGESAGPHMDAALVRWRADDAARQRDGVSVEERVAAIREAAASPAPPPPPPPPVSPAPFGYRAVVWVNTQNHLMAPFDSNGSLPLRVHSSYPLFPGDRRVAERFGQLAVARKWTLFSLLPACFCCRSSIDRRARAERTRWQRVHHSHVLRGAQGEKEDDTHCDSAEGLREGSKQRAVPSHKTAPLSYECSAPHSTPMTAGRSFLLYRQCGRTCLHGRCSGALCLPQRGRRLLQAALVWVFCWAPAVG